MTYKNILIVKLSAIGDVIHALPVAHALKQCYPEARITWAVEKSAYDLLTNNPDIDEIILFDKSKFKTLAGIVCNGRALARQLKACQFDLALDLQGLFKSAAIAYLSGAPKRLVYCNARELSHWVSQRVEGKYSDGHVVERYLDVVRYLGCKVEQVVFPMNSTNKEATTAEAIANHAGLQMDKPYVILALGTNWPNKCWPLTYFAQLADKLYKDNIIPVMIGSQKDRKLAENIIENTQIPPVDLTGKVTLKQLAYIIGRARAFVGGDTGPMHLAMAVGTPVVALFGPTDAKRNGPYVSQENTVLTAPVECIGCWQRTCPKNEDCLASISVDTVYKALGTTKNK